ncbi:helix-turn-helix domain-containing protein [Bacillus sp. 3255]|uniref:helix-turn-helix transcriptional regulator n=1 Tax=Bacillus sp. 3255 TaxID=2817904 RepID=UPI0028573A80|nr:helix-turn-helix domain-containing protein [Bacillus sp. 3255]MDR6883071.1 DNA-binding XRE family transcriptional regulator [Bacillus sp. 3255]
MEMLRAPRRSKSAPKKQDRTQKPRQRFRELRLSKDITQTRMASDLRVTDMTIRSVENGTNDPSLIMSLIYTFYLGGTFEELFPDLVEEAKMYYHSLQENFSTV